MNAETSDKHKFLQDAGMTFQKVYDFAFKGALIPVMQKLANELGGDSFVEILKRAACEAASQSGQDTAKNLPSNDFAVFTAWARDLDRFWEHVPTFD